MKRKMVLLCAAVILLLIGSVMSSLLVKFTFAGPGGTASIPRVINYQGLLTNKDTGQPLTGTVNITFSLYDTPSDNTSPLWSETHTGMILNKGLFNVLLGSLNPLSADLFTGATFLAVKVGTDPEMTPRRPFSSVPYAFQAENANTLDGMDSADFMTAGNVKQLIHDFVIASGANVTAGDVVSFLDGYVKKGVVLYHAPAPVPAYVFNLADTGYGTSVVALSSTKFVVTYMDAPAKYGTAVIGDVSDNTITYGSEYVFNSAETPAISVAALSPTRFVVAYSDSGNSYYGTAVIGDVSGNTITYGSEYVFNPATTHYVSAFASRPWDASIVAS